MDDRGRGLDVIEERQRIRGRLEVGGAEPPEDTVGFFRGLALASAASLPLWIGLVWGVRELV
jgi:hypothetical protein